MSLALIEQELPRFLHSKEPEVLCITGKWGVGKTFAWCRLLASARAAGTLGFNKYSYVSLFGMNTISEARTAVAENTVTLPREGTGDQPNANTFGLNLETVLAGARAARRASRFFPVDLLPKGGAILGSADQLIYLAMRDQIICIDDLERAGKELTPRNVLGLASQLKEQKNCKIVLLLNSDELSGDGGAEFVAHLEKVADTILRFEPTPAEAAKIAVNDKARYAGWVTEACVRLAVTNIRIIKKAERLVERFCKELASFDERILRSAAKTIVLATVAKFQPGSGPTLEFLKELDQYKAVYLSSDNDETHSRWMSFLHDFEYVTTDELDSELIQAVERGALDVDAILRIAAAQQRSLEEGDEDETLRAAWRLYRESFAENEAEVIEALLDGAVNAMQRLSPHDLSQITELLRALDQAPVADGLIEQFVLHRRAAPEYWDLNDSSLSPKSLDPAIVAAFQARGLEEEPEPDIAAVIERLTNDNSWGGNDIELLSKLTVEEWRRQLQRAEGQELRKMLRAGLRWRQISNASPEMTIIIENCSTAIRQIATGSRINTSRARDRGIDVPDWRPAAEQDEALS